MRANAVTHPLIRVPVRRSAAITVELAVYIVAVVARACVAPGRPVGPLPVHVTQSAFLRVGLVAIQHGFIIGAVMLATFLTDFLGAVKPTITVIAKPFTLISAGFRSHIDGERAGHIFV